MSGIILLFVIPALSILPGAWLAFGLPLASLGSKIRLAIAIAFSPAVLGLQYVLLRVLGISSETAALLVLVGNLPSLWLMRHLRPTRAWWPALSRPAWAATAILFGSLIFLLVAPWLLIDGLRAFSWHALLHTDVIYGLAGGRIWLEEPELGGVSLAFAWIPHTYWAVLGVLADVPPTRLYPLSNVIWLLVSAYLVYEIAASGLRLRRSTALICTALALFSTQSVAYSVRILANDGFYGLEYFGYRLSTIVQKFRGFETMPFGFALLLALILVVIWRLRGRLGAPGVLEGSLLVALGIVYPILFPIGLVLAGSQVLLLLTPWPRDLRPFGRREIVALVLGIILAVAAFVPIYYLYTRGTEGPLPVSFAGRQTKTWQLLWAVLPLLLLSLPAALRAMRQRQGVAALLLWSAACSGFLAIIANRGANEYKYVLTAALLLAPVAALTVERIVLRYPRWEWLLAVGVIVLLFAIDLAYTFRVGRFTPTNLANAPAIQEDHFLLSLQPSDPNAAWVQAVRDNTPPDTLLVATQSSIHLGPFVHHSLYAPSDANGAATTGYSVDNRPYLVEQRRYPAQMYDARVAAVTQFMTSDQPDELNQALETMLAVGRPLAVYFADINTPALRWLQTQAIGAPLYTDGQSAVWLIEPPAGQG